ncbi:MAG: universal stress protein [Thaumarchaeota archaeon]|nr:universal stress protein [Nitrososphaerota archaeon]
MEQPFRKIAVAVDGSSFAARALDFGEDLASKYGAELILINVVGVPGNFGELTPTMSSRVDSVLQSYLTDNKKQAMDWMNGAVTAAKAKGINANSEVIEGDNSVVEAITNYAREKQIDLLIVGTRGKSAFKKLILGSIAAGVVSHANCPVLVVR